MSEDGSEAERDRRRAELEPIITGATDAVAADWPRRGPKLYEHFHYGAVHIAPQHLAIFYMFLKDADLAVAKTNGLTAWADRATREQLRARGYPADVIDAVGVTFVTDEDARKARSFYHYFNGSGENWHSEPRRRTGE